MKSPKMEVKNDRGVLAEIFSFRSERQTLNFRECQDSQLGTAWRLGKFLHFRDFSTTYTTRHCLLQKTWEFLTVPILFIYILNKKNKDQDQDQDQDQNKGSAKFPKFGLEKSPSSRIGFSQTLRKIKPQISNQEASLTRHPEFEKIAGSFPFGNFPRRDVQTTHITRLFFV